MTEFTEEELDRFRKVFDKYDENGNGNIDWDEFCRFIDEMVGGMSIEDKSLAFHLVDTNHTGMISFEEFIDWWGKR